MGGCGRRSLVGSAGYHPTRVALRKPEDACPQGLCTPKRSCPHMPPGLPTEKYSIRPMRIGELPFRPDTLVQKMDSAAPWADAEYFDACSRPLPAGSTTAARTARLHVRECTEGGSLWGAAWPQPCGSHERRQAGRDEAPALPAYASPAQPAPLADVPTSPLHESIATMPLCTRWGPPSPIRGKPKAFSSSPTCRPPLAGDMLPNGGASWLMCTAGRPAAVEWRGVQARGQGAQLTALGQGLGA